MLADALSRQGFEVPPLEFALQQRLADKLEAMELAVGALEAAAGYGITAEEYGYDDYDGLDVSGKFVLLLQHEPQEV